VPTAAANQHHHLPHHLLGGLVSHYTLRRTQQSCCCCPQCASGPESSTQTPPSPDAPQPSSLHHVTPQVILLPLPPAHRWCQQQQQGHWRCVSWPSCCNAACSPACLQPRGMLACKVDSTGTNAGKAAQSIGQLTTLKRACRNSIAQTAVQKQ
jgi:hypothetical protein